MTTKDLLAQTTNATIVALVLEGMKQADIAKKFGCNKSTICRRLQDDDVRELLEYGAKRSALRVPAACDAIDDLLESDDEGIKYKAAELTFKKTGILASQTANIYINHLYQDNRVTNYEPHIQALINSQVDDSIEGEIIE